MAIKKYDERLNCGITITKYGNGDRGEVSIIDMYNGYGSLSDFKRLAELFTELDSLGYKPDGITRVEGYYDSTDDLILDFHKK